MEEICDTAIHSLHIKPESRNVTLAVKTALTITITTTITAVPTTGSISRVTVTIFTVTTAAVTTAVAAAAQLSSPVPWIL
jgi:hypothetical protein